MPKQEGSREGVPREARGGDSAPLGPRREILPHRNAPGDADNRKK
jgi:hypothetical protein